VILMVLIGVVFVTALAVFVVAIVVDIRGSRTRRSQALVAGEPDDLTRQVALALAGLRGHGLRVDGHLIVLTHAVVPFWAIAVAIFAFPFGLVALVARDRRTATIAITPASPGTCRIEMAGIFANEAIGRLNGVIVAASDPVARGAIAAPAASD